MAPPSPGRGGNSDPAQPRPGACASPPRCQRERGARLPLAAALEARSRRAGGGGERPAPTMPAAAPPPPSWCPSGRRLRRPLVPPPAEPALTALTNQRSARGDRLCRASQWRRRRGLAAGCGRPSCGRRRRCEGWRGRGRGAGPEVRLRGCPGGSLPPPRPSLLCGPDRRAGASRHLCPPRVR